MPISEYLHDLRAALGTRLLLVPSVAAVIHDTSGRVLLQRTATEGRWSLPGGAIDPGETPAGAVVREVWEETGLDVRPRSVLAVLGGPDFRYIYDNGDRVEYVITVFACDVIGGRLGGQDDETEELAYVATEETARLALPYPVAIFIRAGSAPALFL